MGGLSPHSLMAAATPYHVDPGLYKVNHCATLVGRHYGMQGMYLV